MNDIDTINIDFSFYDDYFNKTDPDGQNMKLRHWHKILWAKQLPYNKGKFTLEEKRESFNYLYHNSNLGEYYLTSDAMINEYFDYDSNGRHREIQPIISQISKEEINSFMHIITTIGGYIIFPIRGGFPT